MAGLSDGFEQLGRRHWRWRGNVPGEVSKVRSGVVDAIKLLSPSSLNEPDGSTIVARVGGTVGMSWAATEEVTVVVQGRSGGGTDLEISSRSVQWSFTDSGRNRATIERLLLVLGIR